MRLVALFTLLLTSAFAAEIGFLTGQGARLVIGQETFTAATPGASRSLLGAVGAIAYGNDTLFLVDANRLGAEPINQRALIYNNISLKWPAPTDVLSQDSRCPVCGGEADVVVGQETFEGSELQQISAATLRLPLGIATDGLRLAIADTDRNRVLIWNTIPTTNGQPADIVIGQKDFETSASTGFNPLQDTVKGPQSVWLMKDGSMWVADTGNNRVLKWNNPTRNGQPADLVLGAPDFTTFVQPDLVQQDRFATSKNLLTPVQVSSDGQRLFVADLGNSRVLIWNTLPTADETPADLVIGQPDLDSRIPNNVTALCEGEEIDDPNDDSDEPATLTVFPPRCAATVDFPRAVISDGQKLFVADGGNDRILVYDELPTTNGEAADAVIGQVNEFVDTTSDSAFPNDIASAGVMRTPTSLAWDGLNLYATDPFNRRVLVFTMAERRVANTGVRNAASFEVFASGQVAVSGTTKKDDEVTITIRPVSGLEIEEDREYKYTVQEDDEDLVNSVLGLTDAINAGDGDPAVFATPNPGFLAVILTAREAGTVGNDIGYAASVSDESEILATALSPTLKGGGEATQIAPYTIVSIVGEELSDVTEAADLNAENLPTEMGGVQVYFDGIRAPIYFISPTQINAQLPVEMFDTQSVSAYVRTEHQDGSVVASNAIPVPIIPFNPGIFATGESDPRPAIAVHSSSQATGIVSVDGTATADDVATVIIEGRNYSYTITEADENAVECPSGCAEGDEDCEPPQSCSEKLQGGQRAVMNALVELINGDPKVEATSSNQFSRIRIKARVAGPGGNGIPYSTETSDDTNIILTATTQALCCANVEGAPLTVDNPAISGEIIVVWATGLGLVEPEEAREAMVTGGKYLGSEANKPLAFVSSLIGGRTANVLSCGLQPGTFGLHRCDLQINQGVVSNPRTALTIAQGFRVSNIVTIPVFTADPDVQ